MKYFLSSVAIFVVGFSVNKYILSSDNFDSGNDISDAITQYPVDLYEFKQVINRYIPYLCSKNSDYLETLNSDEGRCIDEFEQTKEFCESIIFRLAPLVLKDKNEVKKYGQDYKYCTLPYKELLG